MKIRLSAPKLPKLRLYQQMIAFFLLIVLIPLLGVSFIIYNINQKALKKELTKFTEHTAEALYTDLQTEMSWQNDQVQTLGNYLLDTFTLTHDFDKSTQSIFNLASTYEAVGLYDAQGNNIKAAYRNFSHLSPELRLPFQLPERLMKPSGGQPISFSVQYYNTGSPQENAYYLQSVYQVNRAPYAYYVSLKRFSYLRELVRNNSNTLHSSVFIIDADGQIMAGPPEVVSEKRYINKVDYDFFKGIPDGITREFSTRGPTVPDLKAAAKKSVGKSAKKSTNTADDEEPGALEKVFVKMPSVGWGIIIESPYHVRQTYVKRARDQSLLLIIACLVLVILLSLFYILGINRNFRQLIKATKAMADGNYARRIRLITNTTTPMEIVYLTGEFNRMARKMADAWQNSQELNQELLHKNEQEAFLSRITKSLHGTLSLDEIGDITTRQLGDYLRCGVSVLTVQSYAQPYDSEEGLTVVAEESTKQVWIWENGNYPEIGESQLLEFGLPAYEETVAFTQGQPIHLNQEGNAWLRAFNCGTALLQSVQYQLQGLGYLVLIREPGQAAFTEEETHLLGLIANQIGVAVQQAHQWQTIQEANKKLAKLDELKSNLIDTVSHELRTPLTSIKGYTSRLLRHDEDKSLTPEMRTKSLKVIKQQADRLGRLVEDLLVIPDLETANLRVFPDEVMLPELLDRTVQFVQERVNREIQVTLHDPNPPSVLADPDRLEQIFVNLLDNASKYSYSDTPIQVFLFLPESRGEGDTERVGLIFANECDPIPQEALTPLFEKFKRLDDSLTRTTRGSGLGLFITKSLVEAMGGEISLAYEAGHFQVIVELPVYQESAIPA